MSDDDSFGDDATVVGNKHQLMSAFQTKSRDRAYIIVIAGPNVGEMFKVDGVSHVGRGQAAEIRITDTEISRKHARFIVEGDQVVVEDLNSTNGTFVNGTQIRRKLLQDGDKIQVGTTTILKFSYHDDLDEQFQRKMYDAALRDALTGAFNKKYFGDRLESELAYAIRHGSPLALILFDLDHFKSINDTYGHLAGDYVLRTLGAGVLKQVRREDVFARYGGEEFAMLSRGLDTAAALDFAGRLRAWINGHAFIYEGTRLPVSSSFGVAARPQIQVETALELVGCADKALYSAKVGGRNRVCVFNQS